jgi:hypothetical protein
MWSQAWSVSACAVATGFTAPAVGDDVSDEALDCQASYELWFVPDEEG